MFDNKMISEWLQVIAESNGINNRPTQRVFDPRLDPRELTASPPPSPFTREQQAAYLAYKDIK